MEKSKLNVYGPGLPWHCSKNNKEVPRSTLILIRDGYLLKLYNFASDIELTVFDQLQAQQFRLEDWYFIIYMAYCCISKPTL